VAIAAELHASPAMEPMLTWRRQDALEPYQLGYPRAPAPNHTPPVTHVLMLPTRCDFADLAVVMGVFTLRASGEAAIQIGIYDNAWRVMHMTPAGAATAAQLSTAARALLAARAPDVAHEAAPACAVVLSAAPLNRSLPEHIDLAVSADFAERRLHLVLHRDYGDVAATIIAQLQTALAALCAEPHQQLDQIRFSPQLERALIDDHARGPKAAIPFAAITDSISARAISDPQRLALLDEYATWSFAALQARIDARAAALASLGAAKGAIIGVCLSRSAELLITLLAVIRTGAAYLPLDPAHPTARIEGMIADAEAAFVVVDAETSSTHRLGAAPTRTLGEIDALAPASWRAPTIAAEDLAYVIYTSGSTGQPKGVAVAHATIAAFFTGMDGPLAPHPNDRWLTVTAPTFDPSVLDYFWTLTRGCSVAVYRPPSVTRGEGAMSVAQAVLHCRATHLQCTPSLITIMLVDPEGAAAFAQLRMILVGGEALSRANADAVQTLMAPGGRLINLYGPTEATVWSTVGDVARNGGLITLGRPIANIACHVLAADGAVQAALAPGEIWIEGPNIALGYWRRPELTQAAFVEAAAPFSARMYRTGDIARRWPDGRLEYLGRRDDQVKIRGHRIELGEIERVLERVEGVQRLIVVARTQGDDASDKRLFAYYTQRPGAQVDPRALRAAAATRLPEHMRPQAAIKLNAFELTATGKIDRKKLPMPESEPGVPATADDPITEQLRLIWRDVLGVGGHDLGQSFFDLGGNSLTGARLFARIDEAFGVRLPLACLFDAPTIQTQADLLARRGAGGAFSPLVRIAPGDLGRSAFFCVHGAGGNVVFLQPLAALLGKHRPLIGIQAFGVDASNKPLSDIHDIAARYVAAVRQAQPCGPYLLGGYSGGGAIAIEMAHQLRATGQTVGLVALFDALAPGSRLTGFSLAERIAHLPKVSPSIVLRFVLRRLMPFVAKPVATTPLERAAERTLAAMLSGLDSYRPAPYEGDALLVRAAQARLSYVVAGALLGWEQTMRGQVETLTVDATHDDMFEGEALSRLAARLRTRLDELDPR